jgi:hypothetical protein
MTNSNIFNDISSLYLEEVLKPQLGKDNVTASKGDSGSSEGSEKEGTGDDGAAKRIRQAVYDIRYRARREDIPVDQAFNQYMSHTSMGAVEKTSVKEKLGIGAGAPVKEDAKPGENYLRVVPKRGTGEKAYTRKFDPSSEKDRAKRHKLETRGIKTYLTKHGTPYDSSNDQDGDGDNDFADVMSARMQASGVAKDKANKKVEKKPYNQKKVQQESFSNWRSELFEVVDDEISSEKKVQIKENPKINNKVEINPKLDETIESLDIQLISEEDITEEFLSEEVQIATEYFYNQGLNEEGVSIVIDRLGVEEFIDFVEDLSEEYILFEARAGGTKIAPRTKSGKSVGELKGGAKSAAIKRLQKEKAARREAEEKASSEKPSGLTAALKSQSEKAKSRRVAVKTAKVKQPETKSSEKETKSGIRGLIGHVVKRAKSDTELLKKSWQTAREVGKGHEKKVTHAAATVAGAVAGARKFGKKVEQSPQATRARRKATVAAGRAAQAAGKTAVKAAGAAGAAAGAGVKAKREGKSASQVAGRAAGTFVKKMQNSGYEPEGNLIDEDLHPSVQRIDAISRERVAQRSKNAEAAKQRSQDSAVKFQAFKKKHLEGGGTPVSALDAWQKRKLQTAGYQPQGSVLDEKAESEQQQKLFGLALSVKRGQTPRSEASAEVLKIVDSMSEKKIRDFAKTKHEGIPHKVEEALTQVQQGAIGSANPVQKKQQNTQDLQQKQQQQKLQQQKQQPQNTSAINSVLNAKKNVDAAQQKYAAAQKAAAQKKVNLASLSASYEPEGESIEELNRYEKETGTSSGSLNMPKGRPTQSGGETDPVMRSVRQSMRKMTGKPAGQQKKVKGKKPPKAGEYGSERRSPSQIVSNRRASAQRSQDMMHSRFD